MNAAISISTVFLLATALGYSSTGQAQPAALAAQLRDCLALTDNLSRLTCYDTLTRQQLPAAGENTVTPEAQPPAVSSTVTEPAAAPAPAPAAASPSPAATPAAAAPPTAASNGSRVESFGQTQARVEAAEDGAETLVDVVVEARRVEPTKWQLTLQSGQVWRQTVGKSYLIRQGDRVRISSSSWGEDFRLSVDGSRSYIQVRRLE